ncbi:hypothetical protein MMC25_001759 [Agyrium rufum]|nr:hypothetical protein [Agyrium rufum]
MRPFSISSTCGFLTILSILHITTATPQPAVPFKAPLTNQSPSDPLLRLFARQTNNCPSGYNPCTNLDQPNICCSNTDICTSDAAKHLACCPSGAACTGTIGDGAGVTSLSSGVFVPATATASTTGTSSNGYVFPTSTLGITAFPQSTVVNPYFPWLFIPTSFSNAQECSSYYTSCQSEYQSCTQSLGGAGFGVTVAGPGGGTTVVGSATQAAQSVCSSLYNAGCYGLQTSVCGAFGNGGVTQGASGSSGAGSSKIGGYGLRICGVMVGLVSVTLWLL